MDVPDQLRRSALIEMAISLGLSFGGLITFYRQQGTGFPVNISLLKKEFQEKLAATSEKDKFVTPAKKRKGNPKISPDMKRLRGGIEDEESRGPPGLRGGAHSANVVGETDEDGDAMMVASADSSKKGKSGGVGETPIDPIPVARFNPFPNTINAILPYFRKYGSTSVATTACSARTYRLNSIYDVETSSTYAAVDPTTVVADTADGTLNTPYMRDFWKSIYQYWSVVKSEWKVRIRADTQTNDDSLMAYRYLHGIQRPPTTVSSGANTVHHQLKSRHKNCAYKEIVGLEKVNTSGVTSANYWKDAVEFSGVWTPGSIEHEVMEDELAQTWHKILEVPPTPELLTIHIQHSPHSQKVAAMAYIMEFSITYTCQYKDLVAQFEYITEDTSLAAVANFATQSN